jgi:quinol monooxygenase YgiN
VLVVEAVVEVPWVSAVALLLAGAAWSTAITSTSVAAQTVLPAWVRARGMGLYMLVIAGGIALGSALWGAVADRSLTAAHLAAAATLVVGTLISFRWHLASAAGVDVRMTTGEEPLVTLVPRPTDGPVLVTVTYEVPPEEIDGFAEAMRVVERHRRRTGAYRWGLFRDLAAPDRFVETFVVESWAEHLRQHSRATVSADLILGPVRRFLGPSVSVGHFLSVYSPGGRDPVEPADLETP